jgi:hypothetical protein
MLIGSVYRTAHRMRIIVAAICIAAAISVSGHAQQRVTTSFRVQKDGTTLRIANGQRSVLSYRFGDVPYKPYVQTFCTPTGINILRDSPHDHKHHHAMMFAVAVDGVDFWAEYPHANPGRQVQSSLETISGRVEESIDVAGVTGTIRWLAPDDTRLLDEERMVRTYSSSSDCLDASLVTWRSQLRPAPGRTTVTLSGSHYFGLGLRFVESMDKGGRFIYEQGEAGTVVRGQEHLTRTKWVAYASASDGRPVTVAVFDHPQNPRHPAVMFTMPQRFAYIAATLNLWKQPLVLAAEKPVTLRYGVALWEGHKDRSVIDQLYRRWTTLAITGVQARLGVDPRPAKDTSGAAREQTQRSL